MAPPSVMSPNNAISGNRLAVEGRVFSTTTGAASAITSTGGGGVTTSASCTSSPLGLAAMIGAALNWARTGAAADLGVWAMWRGSSAGVNRTGMLLALAIAIALAFG